jgi:integrase/recombinase XerD
LILVAGIALVRIGIRHRGHRRPDGPYDGFVTAHAEIGPSAAPGAHALRATAATNALDHQADIAKVQEWLGHANIATTRIYDHRKTRPEDSPTSR